MILSLIVAMSRNRVIGKDNKLPWQLPEDLKHFKETTMGCPIIMGRKTYDSIGRLLPGRENIVITRNSELRIEGATLCSSLDEAINHCKNKNLEEVFIIGGAQIFNEALSKIDKLYLTVIDKDIEGDTYLSAIDLENEFQIISKESHCDGGPEKLSYSFIVAERR